MFTGLIEEIGRLRVVAPAGGDMRLSIACAAIMPGMRRGDSIAVDGCCLTAETIEPWGFTAYASPETLRKTSLGERSPGDAMNLERALALGARLGGHIVSGHVDATGTFRLARQVERAWELRIGAPREIITASIAKGSIAIDGISLTIVDLADDELSAWIIPETWERTTLSLRKPGQRVNLESDLLGKYVYRFLETREPGTAEKDARLRELMEGGGWGAR